MAFSVCVWSDCPAVQRVGCKQAKRPNVWAWVWKLMCFCEGKEKYVCLWGGRKSTQASAKSFGLLAHQGCGRIALITLHSGAQTHTHTHMHSAVLSAQQWPEAHPHSYICLSSYAHTIICAQTEVSVCEKQIIPNKNLWDVQIWAPLSFYAKCYILPKAAICFSC